MNMPRTIDELSEIDENAGVVINGIDNANLMSVDSTEPIETKPEEKIIPEGEIPLEKETDASDKEPKSTETVDTELDTKKDDVKDEEEKQGKKDDSLNPESESQPEDSKNVQKRIGKLTKKMRTAERERDYEKNENTELKRKLEELTSKVDEMSSKILDSNKPLKEDFADEDDFIEALTDWKIDQKLGKTEKKEKKEEKKVDQESSKETYYGLDDAMESGRDKYDDFDKLVLDENLIISPEVTQIVLDTDTPEDVIYYLASNPKKSKSISNLDPVRAAREKGKMEGKVEKELSKPKPSKKQSKAPSPIIPVRTEGVTEKDPNKMSPKEYKAWRNQSSK